jgi:hypothetical protein
MEQEPMAEAVAGFCRIVLTIPAVIFGACLVMTALHSLCEWLGSRRYHDDGGGS